MESTKQETLPRSKSTGNLDKLEKSFDYKYLTRFCGYARCDNQHASVSSIDGLFECNNWDLSTEEHKLDSGIGKSLVDGESLFVLEQKVDKLSELLQEHHNLLKSIKEEVNDHKTHGNCKFNIDKIPKNYDYENELANETTNILEKADEGNSAQNLLNAIEVKQDSSLDQMIKDALENFLRSEGLKKHVAAVTADCVKGVVRGSLLRVVSGAYLPLVERSHRRLIKHVTKLLQQSFVELEEVSGSLFRSVHKASRNIRMLLERHQNLLEATDPQRHLKVLRTTLRKVLEEELHEWRGRLIDESTPQASDCSYESERSLESPYVDYAPISPVQPANPDISIIDSLMKCALINKHIEDGDINGAFEEALSSSDLSLVMAACRAAPPTVFAPCQLQASVLLSLLQQLATDMVHDTQLKCRYLEEAILSLDKCDSSTRAHLPLVVGEVRKHLTKFLRAYPKHHASRRVALIVMAADNLLK